MFNRKLYAYAMDRNHVILNDVSGKKTYILGDTVCQADCAIFGQLAQFYWNCPNTEAERAMKGLFYYIFQYYLYINETISYIYGNVTFSQKLVLQLMCKRAIL